MGPLTTAFYNIVALVGLFPELPKAELPSFTTNHHLRGPRTSELAPPTVTLSSGHSSERGTASSVSGSAGLNSVQATSASDSETPVSLVLPAPDALMERRKAKALKLLDAKMMELSQPPPTNAHD